MWTLNGNVSVVSCQCRVALARARARARGVVVVAHLVLEREAVIAVALALLRVLSEAFDRNAKGTEEEDDTLIAHVRVGRPRATASRSQLATPTRNTNSQQQHPTHTQSD